MAVPTGTFQTHQAIGNREDLEDTIYMISPTETPFLTMCDRIDANSTLHEWQTDALAAANTANAAIEGDDAANGTSTPTVRLKNYCQISTKYAIVSGTQGAVRSAGRKNEMAYQLMKRSKELKRDMESIITGEHAATAGAAASARALAGLEAMISTNKTHLGASGTTPGFVSGIVATAPTDGTTAAFTVTFLKSVIRSCYTSGGNPAVVMVGPFNKQAVSGFAGIATLYREATASARGTRIIGAADVYVSDFGEHRVVPNRFQRDRTAFVLDMDYWSVAYLRRFQQNEIAKTGDAEKRQVVVEYTLVGRNEGASGKIADCTTS